jgi:serine/threonine protein kinase
MQRLHTRLIDKPQVVETIEPHDAIQSSKSTVDLLSLTSITTIIPSAEIAMDLPLDANVYKACWRRSSVAIKICRDNGESSDAASILRSEIEKLSLLRHPRLVSLLGCCVDVIEVRGGELVTTEGYGLVLEYMEKGNLRMMLDREHDSMSWLQRVTIATDICEGMRFLHESQVYHGQLRSENVLVDDQGRAKLINFGRSNGKIGNIKTVEKNTSSSSKVDDKEMADQKRADIYCFAVILWELITGQIPSEEKVTRRQKLMLEGFKLSECPSTIIACFNQCIDSCGVNFVEVNNTAVSNANASTVSSKNNKKKAKKQQKQQLQQQQQQAPVSVVENVEKPIPSFHELFDDLHSVLLRMTQRLAERDRYIPDGFLCPITQDVMKDPVILLDGHSYERKAILDWFKRSDRSPLTNESLSSDAMIENYSLKSAIEGFLATFHNK